jgi:hypothetical protein
MFRRSRLNAAMFCPECKAEYRQGFTRCADCDVDLVYELESESAAAQRTAQGFRVIWRGVSQESCLSVCYQLRDLGINYKVTETLGSLGLDTKVSRRYALAVPLESYERTKAALHVQEDLPSALSGAEWEKLEAVGESDEPNDPQVEVNEVDEIASEDFWREQQIRREAYLRPWYPGDASVEIWSQDHAEEDDISGAVEMALKENLIRYRLDVHDRIHKVFVLPEDERQAREIVQEIREEL